MSDEQKKLNFDPTINLGHVLTFVGFVVTIIIGWSTLDKRVVILEESRKSQASIDAMQDARTEEKFSDIKETLRDIKQTTEKISDRLEARR
jgi:hypothetical protein